MVMLARRKTQLKSQDLCRRVTPDGMASAVKQEVVGIILHGLVQVLGLADCKMHGAIAGGIMFSSSKDLQ